MNQIVVCFIVALLSFAIGRYFDELKDFIEAIKKK